MIGRESPLMHELWAESFESSAYYSRRDARKVNTPPDRRARLWDKAADHEGRAKGHTFRACELLYDARGGMTAEQAARESARP